MAADKQPTSSSWNPTTWKSKPIVQDVVYEDQAHVDRVLTKLGKLPPMVSPQEVDSTFDKGVARLIDPTV